MNSQSTTLQLLAQYHTAIYKLLGFNTVFINGDQHESYSFCRSALCNPLCVLIHGTVAGRDRCRRCDTEGMRTAKAKRSWHTYSCHAGLMEIIVPLFIRELYVGALCSGQIFDADSPFSDDFEAFLDANDYLRECDPKKLRTAFDNTRRFTRQQVESLCEMINFVGSYIADSEFQLQFLEEASDRQRAIQRAVKYIEANFRKPLTVAAIAAHVSMSASHLSHLFKQQTGGTPIQYMNRCRIRKAMRLLEEGTLPVTEIAFRCGYQTISHFNASFLRQTGLAPRAYRRINNSLILS